jgi:HAD superfamily hydrolase (TIGR01549 family)
VLFDAGNTLFWLDHGFLVALLAEHGVETRPEALLAAEYGAKRLLEETLREGGETGETSRGRVFFAEVFRQAGLPEEAFPEVAARLRERHAERGLWDTVRPGTAETLEELRRRGYRLGVVSNADGGVEALLESVGLRPHFDLVVDSAVAGVEKPDPRIFHLVCEGLVVDPRDAVYVGDIYETDVLGARGAGMRAFLLDPLDRWGELDCERVRELSDLLERIG